MNLYIKRVLSFLVLGAFLLNSILPPLYAQTILNLPVPGSVVLTTAGFAPAIIKGINLYPDNPLKFDFIIDKGDTALTDEAFKQESTRLIKYFLSSLTVPEDEMWVNLSPYEKNRIVPPDFGKTEMGRDLLAQDYMLKQLTASLMNPDDKLGGEFWQRVYTKAQEKYGTTDIPMNTFNKIWIVPEKAVVYEHEKGAFVVKSHLKVLLEEDYLSLEANKDSIKHGLGDVTPEDLKVVSGVQSAIIKDLLIPEIEREVNEGQTFANLRQIYNAVILASWYKQALKESLLGQVFVDKKMTKGVETDDKTINEQIYNQYVESFKKGVYNTIKEDYNPQTQEVVNRKYFSGGLAFKRTMATTATTATTDIQKDAAVLAEQNKNLKQVTADLASAADSDASVVESNAVNSKSDKAIMAEPEVVGGIYNYPNFFDPKALDDYFQYLVGKSKRYQENIDSDIFLKGIEKLRQFISKHPEYVLDVIRSNLDYYYLAIKMVYERAHPIEKYVTKSQFEDLLSTVKDFNDHPELISALFLRQEYPDFQISVNKVKLNEDLKNRMEQIKNQLKVQLEEADQWVSHLWKDSDDQRQITHQKKIYAYLLIRQKQKLENQEKQITGKMIGAFLKLAEKDGLDLSNPAQAISNLENVSEQEKIEALFTVLVYGIANRESTVEEILKTILSYGYAEDQLRNNFKEDHEAISALSAADQIVQDRFVELQKASRLFSDDDTMKRANLNGQVLIPKKVVEQLNNIRKEIVPILILAGESVGQAKGVFNFRYMGFEAGYRGYAGQDCTECSSNRAYMAIHPSNHYYAIEQDGQVFGYVGLTEVNILNNPKGPKLLVVDTIQSPDSIIPSKNIPDILDKLDVLAKAKGFAGIALPYELGASFNHEQISNAVKNMTEYKNGDLILLEVENSPLTKVLKRYFKEDLSASLEEEIFVMYSQLPEYIQGIINVPEFWQGWIESQIDNSFVKEFKEDTNLSTNDEISNLVSQGKLTQVFKQLWKEINDLLSRINKGKKNILEKQVIQKIFLSKFLIYLDKNGLESASYFPDADELFDEENDQELIDDLFLNDHLTIDDLAIRSLSFSPLLQGEILPEAESVRDRIKSYVREEFSTKAASFVSSSISSDLRRQILSDSSFWDKWKEVIRSTLHENDIQYVMDVNYGEASSVDYDLQDELEDRIFGTIAKYLKGEIVLKKEESKVEEESEKMGNGNLIDRNKDSYEPSTKTLIYKGDVYEYGGVVEKKLGPNKIKGVEVMDHGNGTKTLFTGDDMEKIKKLVEGSDSAMTTTKGGIDLNPAILSTEIKRNGHGVIIPAFKGVGPDLKGVEGFVPNIINVTPIVDLPLLLGVVEPHLPKRNPTEVGYNLSFLPMESRRKFK